MTRYVKYRIFLMTDSPIGLLCYQPYHGEDFPRGKRWVLYRPYSAHPEAFEAGTDLILFDYGGMCLGNSLIEDNSRYLIRFAQDNPNVLCVIVSGFTWRQAIARELENSGLTGMHNVVPRWWEPAKLYSEETKPEDYDPIPEWFRLAHKLPRVYPYATAVVTKLKTPKRRK